MLLVDTHAHLDFPQFDADREQVIKRAVEGGVVAIVNAGAGLVSSQRAVALADAYPEIWASVGVHPHEAKTVTADTLTGLRELADHPKVVAVGEIGLDYYRDLSPRDVQRRVFRQQLDLAREVGRPIIVHDRQAHADVLRILRQWVGSSDGGQKPVGVVHCFSGDLGLARELIELGFYVGIDGPVTYSNAGRLREVVAGVPLERVLIETDCPYLTPHPHRGRRNEPAYVRLVAEAVAEVKGAALADVIRVTTGNARRLFDVDFHQPERKDEN